MKRALTGKSSKTAPGAGIQFGKAIHDTPTVRYMTGRLVLDEMFRHGRLCTRYWSPSAQVWPEMHIEHLNWGADEPADTFVVGIEGHGLLAGGYQWIDGRVSSRDTSGYRADAGRAPVEGVVTLGHSTAPVQIKVHTRVDGDGFLIRWLDITNTSKQAIGLHTVVPFAGMLWAHRNGCDEHLPPGGGSPFELAYNHGTGWGAEGDFFIDKLENGRVYFDGGRMGRSGHTRPAFWARNIANGQTFVVEQAWSGNFFFELDTRLSRSDPRAMLYFKIGLAGHDRVLRVLAAGETLRTPEVHLALFAANHDAIVQATHDHVRHVVLPRPVPGRRVEIEANHRGYLCDRENEPAMKRDIDVAASMGTEMYVVDAGWYGREPNIWWNNAGDWHAAPWLPNGLEPVVQHAKRRGMKFGLWIEIEAAGSQSGLREQHPDWLLHRNGKVVNERALDLSLPEVVAWCESEIARCIEQYDLDMYRIDHNHYMAPSGNRVVEGITEDVMWRYYDNFCAMFERLQARYPKVVFQNCAGGGGRLDWGTLHRFDNTEPSDTMRQPGGLKLINGLTHSLPPEILLRTFGTEVGGMDVEADLDSQLRLAFLFRPILRGIAPDLASLAPALRERIEHYVALYRSFLRPVLEDCRMYHHTPFMARADKSPWVIMEYAARDRRCAMAGIFRINPSGPDLFMFMPRGLDAGLTYDVTLDTAGQTMRLSGAELMRCGIPVRIDHNLSSELVLFKARAPGRNVR